MMRSEIDTPIEQRFLCIEGKVSLASLELIKRSLPSSHLTDTIIVFVGYAYADIPLTKRFEVLFPKGRPKDGIRCECQIIAVTQEFGKSFTDVPHGWKTICVIQFADSIPPMINQLPVVDAWGRNEDYVCLCDEATWKYLISNSKNP